FGPYGGEQDGIGEIDASAEELAARVNMSTLISRGLIRPGEVLFDRTRRHQARLQPDGSLISAQYRGSIHQVGALVQGETACNGWGFWYVQRMGEPTLIDLLRQQLPRRGQLSVIQRDHANILLMVRFYERMAREEIDRLDSERPNDRQRAEIHRRQRDLLKTL